MFGNVKIRIKRKYSVESNMIPKLWVFKEITKLRFPKYKKTQEFGKYVSDCVHIWVKFSIWNAFVRVSRWKKAKIFPDGASCPGFLWNVYISCLIYWNLLCRGKFVVAHLHSSFQHVLAIYFKWMCELYFLCSKMIK